MNFYNKLFNGPLVGSVGNAMNNDPDDVRTTKRNLQYAGYFDVDNGEDDPENPILTRALDTRIKSYQADRNLKVDGILKPGGETERSLFETLTRRTSDDVFGPPERSDERIGFGGGFGSRMASAMVQPKDNEPHSPFALNFKNPERENERTSPHLRRVNEKALDQNLEGKPIEYDATGRMIKPRSPDKPLAPVPPLPQIKPETISPTPKGQEILDFIGKLESSGDYNIDVGSNKALLTKMTVKEVRQFQKMRRDNGFGTPAGKYQIMDITMDELIKKMGLDGNEIFDEKMQDQMARQLLKKRGFEDYRAGKISAEEFIKELSKEWAAIPTDESNESYYKGTGNNKALTDYKTVKDLLEK